MDRDTRKSGRRHSTRGVTHDKRPSESGPAHISLQLRRGLPSLRTPRMRRTIERAIRNAHRAGFSIVEYSILSNHMHLIVEADTKADLSRGMQGFGIRLAKALNKSWRRKGTVFAERYFARFLTKVTEIHRALRHVLQNARKHGIPLSPGQPDPYSSAPWFRWTERFACPRPGEAPTGRAQTMAAHAAFQLPLSIFDLPGPHAFPDTAFA